MSMRAVTSPEGLRERRADVGGSDRAKEGAARGTPPRSPDSANPRGQIANGASDNRVEGVNNARQHQEQ